MMPRTVLRASARFDTYVGSQPVFWMTSVTFHVPSPSASAPACTSSSFGEQSACHSSQRGKRAISRSSSGSGGLPNAWKRSQPPISTRAELRMLERLPRRDARRRRASPRSSG